MKTTSKKSFGLIETLIACAILIIISGAVMAINVVINNNIQFTRERAHAYYRAVEAIEAVRNIRDSNYIDSDDGTSWSSFVCNTSAISLPVRNDPEAKYLADKDCPVANMSDRFMLFPVIEGREGAYRTAYGVDYYYYLTFEDSGINPEITDDLTDQNSIKVTATIEWNSRGRNHSIELREVLTNWKQSL